MTLGQWVTGQDVGRIGRYAELLDFYNGAQWSGRPRYGERRITFNYARTFVRKVVSYLFGEPARWSAPGEGAAGDRLRVEAAEAALAEVAEANDLTRLDFDTAIDAAVLGDGAFKVTWDPARRLPLVSRGGCARALLLVVAGRLPPADAGRRRCTGRRMMRGEGRGMRGAEARTVPSFPRPSSLPLAPHSLVVEDWRPDRYRVERGGQWCAMGRTRTRGSRSSSSRTRRCRTNSGA